MLVPATAVQLVVHLAVWGGWLNEFEAEEQKKTKRLFSRADQFSR